MSRSRFLPPRDPRAQLARQYRQARRPGPPAPSSALARRRPVAGDDRPALLQQLVRMLQPKKAREAAAAPAPRPAPPAATSGWGEAVELGGTMQLRARRGFRPAVVQVRPGLHLVAEVPRTSTEVGVFPLIMLAPAIAKAVSKAAKKKEQGARDIPANRPASPSAPAPRWLDDEDLDELGIDIGAEEIAACACQRRRARSG